MDKFDFRSAISNRRILFLGEGNMSFVLSLLESNYSYSNIIVTTFERYNEMTAFAKLNASILNKQRVKLLFGVDGTKLQHFADRFFDNIIFQFPYSRYQTKQAYNNCNYNLVNRLLHIAKSKLANQGSLVITHVDNDYYNALFNLKEIGQAAGYKVIKRYYFDPKDFQGYKHQMTYSMVSGITQHEKFVTVELGI